MASSDQSNSRVIKHITQIPFGMNSACPLRVESSTPTPQGLTLEDRDQIRECFEVCVRDCNGAGIARIRVDVFGEIPGEVTVENLTRPGSSS